MTYPCRNDRPPDRDMLAYMDSQGAFRYDNGARLDIPALSTNIGFHEFSLEELQLPDATTLLSCVSTLAHIVSPKGWCVNGKESSVYTGYSLNFNTEFVDPSVSRFAQTLGSRQLTQLFGREVDTGTHTQIRDTYYDTYAFRTMSAFVEETFYPLFSRFSMPIIRSRIAYRTPPADADASTYTSNHVDEFPYQLLRVNIPLQTEPAHTIVIEGEDNFGNSLYHTQHLEVGNAYIWNTRVPHRNALCANPSGFMPRIHLVLGLSPWFDYDSKTDSYSKGPYWGMPISEIIRHKLFVRQS